MTKNTNFVSHKKSKLKNQDGSPQLPSASALVEGEIAINFGKDVETLSIKNESGDVVTFSSDKYYSEQKLGSAFTGANSAVTVTEYIDNLDMGNEVEVNSGDTPTGNTIEIWIDESVEPEMADVYSKSEVDTLLSQKASETDLETLSSTTTAHTANTDIHLTSTEKTNIGSLETNIAAISGISSTDVENWNTAYTNNHTHGNKSALDAITGNVGTMAYENASSYSSATEVNEALSNKADTSDLADFFDDAKYELSGTTHVINFYNDNTIKATIDAEPFIIDGMVESVSAVTSGDTTVLDIKWNTAAGGQETIIDIGDIFEADNYYTKSQTSGSTELTTAFDTKVDKTAFDDKLGSAFTGANSAVTVTDVIVENEQIIAAALTDLEERKLDASAYTPTEELWVSGTGECAIIQKQSGGFGGNFASGDSSIALGSSTNAWGFASHSEGYLTVASGDSTHAEGYRTNAYGYHSHAEGNDTNAYGDNSHVEGRSTYAYGENAHAEGEVTYADGDDSHAEGADTEASGYCCHAEGHYTSALTYVDHAEGEHTLASGAYSHSEGYYTEAKNAAEHASGYFNASHSGATEADITLFSIGNGDNAAARHNAFEVMQNGDIYITSGNTDIKLQDHLGGGGSITVDQTIDSGTSASTNAVSTSAVYGFVTSYTPSITVDQVLDNTTSASTNPVSSKAVYDAVTDNELVWTNAYVSMSGAVSSHTSNSEIHMSSTEKTNLDSLATNIEVISGITSTKVGNWDTAATNSHTHGNKATLDAITASSASINSLTGTVGTMAFENKNSYSSATEVNTALNGKSNTGHTHVAADVTDLGTMAKENKTSYSSATEVNTALSGKSNTGHTHASNEITAMTGYASASTASAIATSDTLNQAIGKLEKRTSDLETKVGGMSITQVSGKSYYKLTL